MKFILSILFCFICFLGFGQSYPNPGTTNGSPTTKVTTKGGLFVDSTFGIPKYTDTTTANTTRSKLYAGSFIYTTSDNATWVRNSNATKWLQISGSGSGGIDSITTQKQNCQDIQLYWVGGVSVAYDTIMMFDGISKAGSITETSPDNFTVTEWDYSINCVQYHTPPADTILVTNGFDTLPRFYTVFANALNQAGLIVGEESLNPIPPQVTPNQQILLGYILETSTGNIIIPVDTTGNGNFVSKVVADTIYPGAKKYILDTLTMGKDINSVDQTHAFPSSDLRFQSWAYDTTNNNRIQTAVDLFNSSVPGTAIPSYGFIIYLKTANLTNRFNSDGSINFQNNINFLANRTISATNTILIAPQTANIGVNIANPGSPLATNTPWFKTNIGGSTAPQGAIADLFQGDRSDTAFKIMANGNLSNGNGAYRSQASFSSQQKGRYVIFDTTHTTNRDGIVWKITSTSITLAGSGIVRAPTITATNFFGGRPAVFSCTVSGGALATITILDPGSSYFAGGSLSIDTSGCTIGVGNVLPTATYSVTQFSFDLGAMVYNVDSACYQSWNGSSWDNMREGSGGGGGFALTDGNATTASGTAVDLGGTATGTIAINPSVAGSQSFLIGTTNYFGTIGMVADVLSIGAVTSMELNSPILTSPSLTAQHNAADSMLVWNPADGSIGYRAIPSSATADTLTFNSSQFRIRNDTLNRIGTPYQIPYPGADSIYTSSDSLRWDANFGIFNVTGYLHVEDGADVGFAEINPDGTGFIGDHVGVYSNYFFSWDQSTGFSFNGPMATADVNISGTLQTPQTPGIDLSGGDFTVTVAGAYWVNTGDATNSFILPDATAYTTTTIDIFLGVKTGENANITAAGGNIYTQSGGTLSSITGSGTSGTVIHLKTLNGNWYKL